MKTRLFLSLSLLSLSLHAADAQVSDDTKLETLTGELGGLNTRLKDSEKKWGDAKSLQDFFKSKKDSLKGLQGEPGVNGTNGERGLQGDSGKDGVNGERGLQGDQANLTSENILKALTDNQSSGMDQFVIAMMKGDTGRRFMASFLALRARETTKSITGTRKMKDAATGTDDASATVDTSESKKKSRIPSLRRKDSKKKSGNNAAALDDTSTNSVKDDTVSDSKGDNT